MTDWVPTEPAVPETQRGEGELRLRYEDVTQDGRLRFAPMMQGITVALWSRTLLEHPSTQAVFADGIVPLLSRLRMQSLGGPVGVLAPLECRGAFETVRAVDDEGRARFRTDMWVELSGQRGRMREPSEERGSTVVGRILAEHTFTRPFGPPDRRRVDELPEAVRSSVYVRDARWVAPPELLELPEGAEPLEHAYSLDPCPFVFGLGHTDSNQHVNSLVYPALLEDAALRRFHALGVNTQLFAHAVDLAYRKPFFAGDRARLVLQAFRAGEELGVSGAFIAPEDALLSAAAPSERSHCFVRMLFRR
jgi:hypothetical protein